MGQTACKCICNKDTQNLNIDNQIVGNFQRQSLHKYSLSREDLNRYNENIKKIIKIQSFIRGTLIRKKYKNEISAFKFNRKKAAPQRVCKQVDNVPDFSNESTRKAEATLGTFIYDQPPSPSSDELVERGPFQLDNNAIYIGQWD